jgi:hypothetical protein
MCVDGAGNQCQASDLMPTGKVRESLSTRKGNEGGISVQEEFVDLFGRAVTRHTVYNRKGVVIHGPHFRPGGFK